MTNIARARKQGHAVTRKSVSTRKPKVPAAQDGVGTDVTEKRRYLRFRADSCCAAEIDLSMGPREFTPRLKALVYEESYGGCGLVVLATVAFERGDQLRVQVGRMSPMRAEVRWCQRLDRNVQKIGLMYME